MSWVADIEVILSHMEIDQDTARNAIQVLHDILGEIMDGRELTKDSAEVRIAAQLLRELGIDYDSIEAPE